MAQKPRLEARQSTQLNVNLRTTQALGMLATSTDDLEAKLLEATALNPFIRLRSRELQSVDPSQVVLAAPEPSHEDRLFHQILSRRAPDSHKDIAIRLLGYLTEEGFLEHHAEPQLINAGVSDTDFEASVRLLQRCEPAGVGARNLKECLYLQLLDVGVDEALADAVLNDLESALHDPIASIAERFSITEAEATELRGHLRGLRPHAFEPASELPHYLLPDVRVTLVDNQAPKVELVEEPSSRLILDHDLLKKVLKDKEASELARDRAAEARALLQALAYREGTILRISRAIVQAHPRFFLTDPGPLSPLSRADIADRIDLHPSTVGRAVARKAVDFQGRVYPLSFFFSSSLPHGGTDKVSAHEVQTMMRQILSDEGPSKIFSDTEIQQRLRAEGVDIARRTIAKYRGCMNVPSSSQRRRLYNRNAKV